MRISDHWKEKSVFRVHFVGIGGIGVSYLARWFKAQNWVVSGSDLKDSQITRDLQKDGINVKIGHKTGNLPGNCSLLVYGQAISPKNPEIVRANRLKVPSFSFPQIVGRVSDGYVTFAVAGAHGKSTTTTILGLILEAAGLDPTVFVGTKVFEFGGSNFREGESEYLVLEADEYGKAFLSYSPSLTVITNIDEEHLDTYGSLARVKRNFILYLKRLRENGVAVLNRDDKNLFSLREEIETIIKKKNGKIVWYSLKDPETKKVKQNIRIPGEHNLSNALGAYKAARELNVPEKVILNAIQNYEGSWRRTEFKGNWKGAKVYDDYAHHPAEIQATLRGLREKHPKKKIVCVFEPHQAERLSRLFSRFVSAFEFADQTIILPVYKVSGRENKDTNVDSARLVKEITKKYPKREIFYLNDPAKLATFISRLPHPPSSKVIVMMGAGGIAELTGKLLRS